MISKCTYYSYVQVLHKLMECDVAADQQPVVGISNWLLDAAKMYRAVYVSRSPPTVDDLKMTAKGIVGDLPFMDGKRFDNTIVQFNLVT